MTAATFPHERLDLPTSTESETLTLSPRDWKAFFASLDKTDKPRPALKAAASDFLAWRKKQATK